MSIKDLQDLQTLFKKKGAIEVYITCAYSKIFLVPSPSVELVEEDLEAFKEINPSFRNGNKESSWQQDSWVCDV